MRKQAYILINTLALVITLSAAAAVEAQSLGQQKADIPFEFQVGGKLLPAGEYTIRLVNRASDQTTLQLRSVDGRAGAMVQMLTARADEVQQNASLVFNRYGDRFFLSQVWMAADSYGLELPKSRTERALENEIGRQRPGRETIALNVRRK